MAIPYGSERRKRQPEIGVVQAVSVHWGAVTATRLLAYFRQRYEGRVEIGPDGEPYQVLDPRGAYSDERLHLAVSEDGRHFTPLNDGQPVWDRWLRDPFL